MADAKPLAPRPDAPEDLTEGNTTWLFGKPFAGLVLNNANLGAGFSKINQSAAGREPMLARIYGFSWNGAYYKLPNPAVFLVYGPGYRLAKDSVGRENALASQAFLDFRSEYFAPDILAWSLLDLDYSVRIEIVSGFIADILLAIDATDGNNMTGPEDHEEEGPGQMRSRITMAGRIRMVQRPNNS